jgi:cytoskeletal protein CcmA (bactofilin family)
MFGLRRGGTVIGSGLKIVGDVTAEGLIEVNGQIEGNLRCTSLIISPSAHILGSISAERVVVNGRVEGPIHGGDVILKSQAHVLGDIHHQSLTIEKGAHFVGGAANTQAVNGRETQKPSERTLRKVDVAVG